MSGAVKNDKGKTDLSLIPRVALIKLAEAMEVGERKYTRYNYCKGMKASREIAALLRHATAWFDGEELDPDGQHHLGSVMACAAMILRQQELGTLTDDRYVHPTLVVEEAPHPSVLWEVRATSRRKGRDSLRVQSYFSKAEAEQSLPFHAALWIPDAYVLSIHEVPENVS